jgi:hypothetical protein
MERKATNRDNDKMGERRKKETRETTREKKKGIFSVSFQKFGIFQICLYPLTEENEI